jgi:DNA helicase-2/ATP-dependent DNA helicase PcrA
VVITRAKQRLWITYTNARYRFGTLVQNEPSRFIEEVPAEMIDKSFAGGGTRNQGSTWGAGAGINRMKGWGAGKDKEDGESGGARKQGGTYFNEKPSEKPAYLPPKSNVPKVVEHVPSADFVPSDTSHLTAGQKVEHQKFGFGEVVKMEGAAHNPIATVKFVLNGEKKIMLNYAKLRIIE